MQEMTAQIVLGYMKGYIDQAVRTHEQNVYTVCETEESKSTERAIIRELKNIQDKFQKITGEWPKVTRGEDR